MAEKKGKQRIVYVDDDPSAGDLLLRFCEGTPFECLSFRDPGKALEHIDAQGAEVVISDLRMPGMSGTDLLAAVRAKHPDLPVIIVTAYSSVDSAIEALRLGATDFLKKPFDMEELLLLAERSLEREQLKRENRFLRSQLRHDRELHGWVGQSPRMREVYRIIEKIADVRCNVIIEGESGTGKEVAARAVHNLSMEAGRPFVVVDCGALNDTLLESELFGHEKGAFTGATYAKQGLFEAASGGTIFLDEIGNISDAMQIKLLRVIQEQQISRVGGVKPTIIDTRLLVASNRDLEAMVHKGEFREDLFHRLNVVRITMPPLRERREDIPLLLQHFLNRFAQGSRSEVQGFEADSMQRLLAYDWPGNVRELRNLVERHVALADGPMLRVESIGGLRSARASGDLAHDQPSLEELERRYILRVLEQVQGNRSQAADILGIDKSTLWRKLQRYET